MAFDDEVLGAAAREGEAVLTTRGRRSGKPRRVTIWIATDGGRIFIRSGGGLGRDWPQNLTANGEATLRLGALSVGVRATHLTDPTEARRVSHLYGEKYGSYVKPSQADEPLTKGEGATFELTPTT